MLAEPIEVQVFCTRNFRRNNQQFLLHALQNNHGPILYQASVTVINPAVQ